jgi:cell division protease FtsH
MVTEFGLSPLLGPVGYPGGQPRFLRGDSAIGLSQPYSERTQWQVDHEIARLLREAESRAVSLLTEHRRALEHLAVLLTEHETLDGAAVLAALQDDPVPVSGTER